MRSAAYPPRGFWEQSKSTFAAHGCDTLSVLPDQILGLVTMKRFLLLLFSPLVLFGQTSNTGSSISGSASPAISPNPAIFDVDMNHTGSNIYVDIRAYGAYCDILVLYL